MSQASRPTPYDAALRLVARRGGITRLRLVGEAVQMPIAHLIERDVHALLVDIALLGLGDLGFAERVVFHHRDGDEREHEADDEADRPAAAIAPPGFVLAMPRRILVRLVVAQAQHDDDGCQHDGDDDNAQGEERGIVVHPRGEREHDAVEHGALRDDAAGDEDLEQRHRLDEADDAHDNRRGYTKMAPLERLECFCDCNADDNAYYDAQQPPDDTIGKVGRYEVIGADAEIRRVVDDVGQLVEDAQQGEGSQREQHHELRYLHRAFCWPRHRGFASLQCHYDYARKHEQAQYKRQSENAQIPIACGDVGGVLLQIGHDEREHASSCSGDDDGARPEPAPTRSGIRVRDARKHRRHHQVFDDIYEISLHCSPQKKLRLTKLGSPDEPGDPVRLA